MEDWRRLKMAGSSSGFAEFMSAEEMIHPPGVAEVLNKMYEDQNSLRAKQVSLGISVGSVRLSVDHIAFGHFSEFPKHDKNTCAGIFCASMEQFYL